VGAGACGELAAGGFAAGEEGGDLGERRLEEVVEDEDRALGGGEALEREEERDGQVLDVLVGRLLGRFLGVQDGFREPRADIPLAAVPGGFEVVEAEAGGRLQEPGAGTSMRPRSAAFQRRKASWAMSSAVAREPVMR
jgi:hypothetical protein